MRIITFNIQNRPAENLKVRRLRLERISKRLLEEKADIVCLQEVLKDDFLYLEDLLQPSESRYKPRGDGKAQGEGNPVFLMNPKWRVEKSLHFWLSETPSVPSRAWKARHPRIANWVTLLPNGTSGIPMNLINLHLDHASRLARVKGLNLILSKLKDPTLRPDLATVVCGDFNMRPRALQQTGLLEKSSKLSSVDLRDAAQSQFPASLMATFTGWSRVRLFAQRVDYCLHSAQLECTDYSVIDPVFEGSILSDHRAVCVELKKGEG